MFWIMTHSTVDLCNYSNLIINFIFFSKYNNTILKYEESQLGSYCSGKHKWRQKQCTHVHRRAREKKNLNLNLIWRIYLQSPHHENNYLQNFTNIMSEKSAQNSRWWKGMDSKWEAQTSSKWINIAGGKNSETKKSSTQTLRTCVHKEARPFQQRPRTQQSSKQTLKQQITNQILEGSVVYQQAQVSSTWEWKTKLGNVVVMSLPRE